MADFRLIDPSESMVNPDVDVVNAIFGYGEEPWWSDSTRPARVLDGPISFEDVFTVAFPWSAEMEQLQYADGRLSSQYGIYRSDTLAELGVHSGNYGNIQPKDLFTFCAAFFREHPEVPISAAISMRGGKVLNISAKLDEIDVLNSGDIHKSYLCFVNSYDSSMKAQAYLTALQAVCMNTTRRGLASAESKMTYKHTKNVKQRITRDAEQAAMLMQGAQATTQQLKEVFEKLAKVKPTKQSYDNMLNELFQFADGESTRAKNVKAEVTQLVAEGINAQAYPDFRGTGYGVYTALTDYVDHYKPVRMTNSRASVTDNQVRFEEGLLGNNAELKSRALGTLEKVLVLSDGSTEVEKTYVDYGVSSTPKRSSIPKIEVRQPDSSHETSSNSAQDSSQVSISCETLYTTAPITSDLPGTTTLRIVEEISDMVKVRSVVVHTLSRAEQIAAYKALGCLAVTEEEWFALKVQSGK